MRTVGRYAVMWSGGKDSALALARARASGLEIGCLVNFIDAASRRVRFHATRAELIARQAEAVGIELRQHATTWEAFERAFRAALASLAADGYAGVVLGDIHLADVRAWYEERVRAARLEHVEPLWAGDPAALLDEFVSSGGRAVVTCCELARLEARWLGRIVDERFAEEVRTVGIDPCGENGEYHSFAFDGPLFERPVRWTSGATRRDGGFLQLDLLDPAMAIATAVADTVRTNAELAAGVIAGRPKAWGALAAKGLVAYRERIGRPLDEGERRALWSALWREVHAPSSTR